MSKTFHYRAVVDVSVRVRPLTHAFLVRREREGAEMADVLPMPRWLPSDEELAPLRALQIELCRDEVFLHRWMASGLLLSLLDGSLVSEDLDVGDPDALLLPLAERLSPLSRLRLREALADPTYALFLDEFWQAIRPVPGPIEIGLERVLPAEPGQIAGARFRATVPFVVEVDEPQDVSVERIARRLREVARRTLPLLDEGDHDTAALLRRVPEERDLATTRELLAALLATPLTLDEHIRQDIVAGIRDGLLDTESTPPVIETLRPLIDRLPPAHRAHLLRPPADDWWIRAAGVMDGFEERVVAITTFEVRA